MRPSRAWPASLPSYFPFALLACSTTLLACSVTPAPEDAATDAPPEPRDAGMDMGTDTGPVRADPALPTASGACPSFDAPATLSFSPAGIGTRQARIWVGPEAAGMDGPLVFYWHGAGGSPDQAPYVLADALTAITEAGGVVVAPVHDPEAGSLPWFLSTGSREDDLLLADEIVACAEAGVGIDDHRIHAIGFSAGALHTTQMTFRRATLRIAGLIRPRWIAPRDPRGRGRGMTGTEYANLVARYLLDTFGHRGITVYREVPFGKTLIGKNRRIDILLIEESSRTAMALECKYQGSMGTTDEKIPYALTDLAQLGMPACLVYAGEGFSPGIEHMLAASPLTAYCRPTQPHRPEADTRELDAALARTFRWWDVVVAGRTPFGR